MYIRSVSFLLRLFVCPSLCTLETSLVGKGLFLKLDVYCFLVIDWSKDVWLNTPLPVNATPDVIMASTPILPTQVIFYSYESVRDRKSVV